jgi:hypothetical protein
MGPFHVTPIIITESNFSKLLQTSPNFSYILERFEEVWRKVGNDLGAFPQMQ